VPQARLQALLAAEPAWWRPIGMLATELAFRYGGATGDLLIRDGRRRALAVLLRLAGSRHRDRAAPPTIHISQSEFAAAANLSRHPAGEILREMAGQGLVGLGYGQIIVHDAAALRALVDDGA